MRVREITEQYQLDHNLKVTHHHHDEKVYTVQSYRTYNFNHLQLKHDLPSPDSHYPAPTHHRAPQQSADQQQHERDGKLSQGGSKPKSQEWKPSYVRSAESYSYQNRLKHDKSSAKLPVIIVIIILLLLFLIGVEIFYPHSPINILQHFTLTKTNNNQAEQTEQNKPSEL